MTNYTPSTLDFCILGIFILLLFATVFNHLLLWKKPENATFNKVRVIVKSWWFIATPTLAAFKMGPEALLALFFSVTSYGLVEIIQHKRHLQPLRRPLAIIFVATTFLQYVAIYLGWKIVFLSLIPLLLIWIVPALVIFKAQIEYFPQLLAAVIGSLLVILYISYIPALPLLAGDQWPDRESALVAILILVFATQANDILQFLSGKSFGRRKIFPLVSPNKTEAGFIGGMVGTAILFMFLGPKFLGISLWQSAIMGPLISVTGMFGDLLFSSLKRYFGVKDFSALIPGHGGIMDRLDSLILTAPLYFHLLYYFKGGLP